MKIPSPLLHVARSLGDLNTRVAFVGGMIREVLVTDPAASAARVTNDVDLIIDVQSRLESTNIDKQLRALGFREAMNEEDAPMCRWTIDGQRVDVMPIDPAILGFSNVWYLTGLRDAIEVESGGFAIRILDAPHFCATKLEAFAGRGGGDFYHHDVEDVIAVVDGRPTLIEEVANASEDLRDYLSNFVSTLLQTPAFVEAVPGHLGGDAASQARLPLVLERLRNLAKMAKAARITSRTRASDGRPTRKPATAFASTLPARTFISSSNLRGAGYDKATRELTIEFHSGGTYVYERVPETVYLGLLSAASAGRYHSQWIKGRYNYRRRS